MVCKCVQFLEVFTLFCILDRLHFLFGFRYQFVQHDGFIANINSVARKYNCDVMVVETGMECADDKGNLASASVLAEGKRQLARVLKECKENTGGRCKGVFYWEPECRPNQYRLGAFTEDGRPTVIMDAFK